MMNEVQQAAPYFWIPLILAYGSALAGWTLLVHRYPRLWPHERQPVSNRPWLDLLLAVLAVGALFAISNLHRQGLLFPQPAGAWGLLAWNLNVLLIYSPLFIVPLLRRQSMETLYLSTEKLPVKVGVGLLLGILAVGVFHIARGQTGLLSDWAREAADPHTFARYFLAVMLEGVALAFFFVRLRWALSLWPALIIPAVLFAAAHVPGSVQEGRSILYIATFFTLNSALAVVILYVVQRSRDVIWLGIVHYLMNIAIGAFK